MANKTRDTNAFGPNQSKQHNNLERTSGAKGLYNQHLNEGDGVPEWKKAGGETVLQGSNNSFVILGRDRAGHAGEGTGAYATAAGAIDLVAGLGGQKYLKYAQQIHLKEGRSLYQGEKEADPNFFNDAARVYITQKGDIDYYFGLAQGNERKGQSEMKSAVAMKADHVRIIATENLKFVTGKAKLQGADMAGERNSGDGEIQHVGKIDFIAGNYTDDEDIGLLSFFGDFVGEQGVRKLQPLVKGENLIEFLNILVEVISDILSMHLNTVNAVAYNSLGLLLHTHPPAVPAAPILPSVDASVYTIPVHKSLVSVSSKAVTSSFNLGTQKLNYLQSSLPTYICSRFVNTT